MSVVQIADKTSTYNIQDVEQSSYKHQKIVQQTGGTSVTLSASSGQESIFEINRKCHNTAKSYLAYTLTPDAAATGDYNVLFKDLLGEIQTLELYTQNGTLLANIKEIPIFTKLQWSKHIKVEEFLSYPQCRSDMEHSRKISSSNSLKSSLDAVRYGWISATNPTYWESSLNYIEPQRLEFADTAAYAEPVLKIMFPLEMFYDTILAYNKNVYYNEIVYLRITWSSTLKVGYQADALTATTYKAALSGATISDLYLYLAVEQNQNIINQLINQVLMDEMKFTIPYVYHSKLNITASTSQSVSVKLGPIHGNRIRKIFHGVFNNTESGGTIFDNMNLTTSLNLVPTKVISYQTRFDSEEEQSFLQSVGNGHAYLAHADLLKGTITMNENMYLYNFFVESNYESMRENIDGNISIGKRITGEHTWVIDMTTGGAAYNHHTFSVCERVLHSSATKGIYFT